MLELCSLFTYSFMCYYPYVQHFSKEEVSISCLFFQVEERERHLAQPLFGAQVDQGQ